jgi:hypothetical protein
LKDNFEPGLRSLNDVLVLDVQILEEGAVDRRRGSDKNATDARAEMLNNIGSPPLLGMLRYPCSTR